jgi:hypothetical protein
LNLFSLLTVALERLDLVGVGEILTVVALERLLLLLTERRLLLFELLLFEFTDSYSKRLAREYDGRHSHIKFFLLLDLGFCLNPNLL